MISASASTSLVMLAASLFSRTPLQVAVVHRGVCPFADKARRAVAAGAVAVVFVNATDELTVPADPARDCADLQVCGGGGGCCCRNSCFC